MILQRFRIIVGDAGIEPGTSAPEVWWATKSRWVQHKDIFVSENFLEYDQIIEADAFVQEKWAKDAV